MTPDEIRKLAIECEIAFGTAGLFIGKYPELATYTAAVEAPLQARIAQLEEALKMMLEAGESEYGEDWFAAARNGNQQLSKSPSTWLSEHDKEVRRDQIKIDASICELQDGMHDALYAEAIIYQHR